MQKEVNMRENFFKYTSEKYPPPPILILYINMKVIQEVS